MTADVYIGGEPYDVLDDIKALRHVPCGLVLFGDNQRIDHVCPLVDCPQCDATGEVLDHINYWGKAETKTCSLCRGNATVTADVAARFEDDKAEAGVVS